LRVCVYVCVCVCVTERERESVCERECVCEKESVCVSVRERVCVYHASVDVGGHVLDDRGG